MSEVPYGCARCVRDNPRRALIISFDVARERDPIPSLAVGSLLAYARSRPGHGDTFEVHHLGFRLDGDRRLDVAESGAPHGVSKDRPREVLGEVVRRSITAEGCLR